MNSMKRQKYMTLKDELPRLVGAQYVTGEEWRNNSRKNEEMEVKQKKANKQQKNTHPIVVWLAMEAKSDAVKNNIA